MQRSSKKFINFFGIWLLNTKKSVSLTYRQVTFKHNLKGEKTKIWKRKPKVTYSVALVMAFLAAENESRQLEDLPQADFGSVPERFLLSVKDQCDNWQLCLLKIRPIAWSYSDSRHVFMLSAHGFANFIRRLSILLFSFFNKDRSQCLRHFKKSVGEKKSSFDSSYGSSTNSTLAIT